MKVPKKRLATLGFWLPTKAEGRAVCVTTFALTASECSD
jgi:hypothetical protein